MLLPSNQVSELLIRDSDEALSRISQRYTINGFGYVYEVGQPAPCFYLAINTVENGAADPSTGEWDFPAGGFEGDKMSKEWDTCYSELDRWMADDDKSEERLREVYNILCSAMKSIRRRWMERLESCVFTVNECNDSDQMIRRTFEGINGARG